ncbi:MAG: hypothetical protein MUC60_16530 [Oscillatoria sp. Prado101]|nr:hypothetical protein [Oscillatoria sp. Prado101]
MIIFPDCQKPQRTCRWNTPVEHYWMLERMSWFGQPQSAEQKLSNADSRVECDANPDTPRR